MNTLLRIGAAVAFALCGLGQTATAQSPCPSGGGYCGPLPYLGYGGYSLYDSEHVPYFALHPPVYYSFPVPRTYGYSPFAYPPGTMTPEIAPVTPTEIINPYVPQTPKKGQPVGSKTATAKPKMIYNPYFTQPLPVSQAVSE
ncbi:MAG TPA: hypothetical protein VFE24_08970 [Pirellulales bacterium]|jgi:hypothetical protein|nr:hypothetical protein [Pirellulales bacterium]